MSVLEMSGAIAEGGVGAGGSGTMALVAADSVGESAKGPAPGVCASAAVGVAIAPKAAAAVTGPPDAPVIGMLIGAPLGPVGTRCADGIDSNDVAGAVDVGIAPTELPGAEASRAALSGAASLKADAAAPKGGAAGPESGAAAGAESA
ncbi:MAG TPA: hypothetical protein VKV34_06395 [Thermoleophilia bacterium]|nr:hypothetical protein [Thermoleophilia bacterium]